MRCVVVLCLICEKECISIWEKTGVMHIWEKSCAEIETKTALDLKKRTRRNREKQQMRFWGNDVSNDATEGIEACGARSKSIVSGFCTSDRFLIPLLMAVSMPTIPFIVSCTNSHTHTIGHAHNGFNAHGIASSYHGSTRQTHTAGYTHASFMLTTASVK